MDLNIIIYMSLKAVLGIIGALGLLGDLLWFVSEINKVVNNPSVEVISPFIAIAVIFFVILSFSAVIDDSMSKVIGA